MSHGVVIEIIFGQLGLGSKRLTSLSSYRIVACAVDRKEIRDRRHVLIAKLALWLVRKARDQIFSTIANANRIQSSASIGDPNDHYRPADEERGAISKSIYGILTDG